MSSLVNIYRVDAINGQSSSSSSSSLSTYAVAVYNATDVDQVSVTANHISVQLPQSVTTSPGLYSVRLQTGKHLPPCLLCMPPPPYGRGHKAMLQSVRVSVRLSVCPFSGSVPFGGCLPVCSFKRMIVTYGNTVGYARVQMKVFLIGAISFRRAMPCWTHYNVIYANLIPH